MTLDEIEEICHAAMLAQPASIVPLRSFEDGAARRAAWSRFTRTMTPERVLDLVAAARAAGPVE